MATIRAYTTIEQSRKLAEILPLETADMYWDLLSKDKYAKVNNIGTCLGRTCVYAWSLAALLSVASTYCSRLEITLRADKKYNVFAVFAVKNDFVFRSFDYRTDGFNNLVDVCVVIIEKLHELNLL